MNKNQSRRVTYAISGLLEFVLRIQAGAAAVEVHFTGGQLSGYGTVPATYSTSDPVMIKLIESSTEFRSGRIRRQTR